MNHKLECELLAPVSRYLDSIGCTVVFSELSFFDRGIDVYGIKYSRPKLSYAVELKLTDWRKAVKQAAIYQLCCDFSYVALPARTAQIVDPLLFRQSGVGLIIVRPDDSVGVMIEPKKSTEQRQFYSKQFRSIARRKLPYATQ